MSHFVTPVLALCGAVLIRLTVITWMSHRRRVLEASRLGAALAVEITALRQHYEDNLSLIGTPGAALLSLRTPGAIFRGNTGRLVALIGERSLAPLAAVYANHERIEALIQHCAKPTPKRPTLAETYRRLADERLRAGRALTQTALQALNACWPHLGTKENAGEIKREDSALGPWQEDDFLAAVTEPL